MVASNGYSTGSVFSLDSNGLRFSITYFQKSQSTDTLGVALVKLLVLGYLLGSNFATDVPIYILALVIGVYQIFHATINLVTYVLYRKNKIRPRFRLLLDGLVLVFLGGTSLLSSTGNSVFQLFVLGAYFFLYGVSNIRDGFLFEEEIGKNHLKRRVRMSLPIVLAALIPASTLAKSTNSCRKMLMRERISILEW